MNDYTKRLLPTGAHMVSGSVQGSLLTTLASVSREGELNKNYSIIYFTSPLLFFFFLVSASLFFLAMYCGFVLSQCFVHLPPITFLLLHPV